MNNFPDWTNASLYPDTKNPLTYTQWAWEFLRRNKKYQEAFLEIQQIEDKADRRKSSLEAGKLFLLTVELLDPWKTTSGDIADDKIFISPSRLIIGKSKQDLPAHQVSAIFDLRYPIAAQLQHIANELIDRQSYARGNQLFGKSGGLKLINNKGRADKYALYLRILDAKSVQPKLKNQKIASIIYSKLLNSKNGQSIERKLNKAYSEAKGLRDEGYREIGMKGSLAK